MVPDIHLNGAHTIIFFDHTYKNVLMELGFSLNQSYMHGISNSNLMLQILSPWKYEFGSKVLRDSTLNISLLVNMCGKHWIS
jgi:hypothetical protein